MILKYITRARVAVRAAILGVLLATGAGGAASASETPDVVDVDATLGEAVDAFMTAYSDESVSVADVGAAARTFQSAAQSAAKSYRDIAARTPDRRRADYSSQLANHTTAWANAAGDMHHAIAVGDEPAMRAAESDFQAAAERYSGTANDYNKYVETSRSVPSSDATFAFWLSLLVIGAAYLTFTVLFAVLARKKHGALPPKTLKNGRVRQTTLKRLRYAMVLWGAVFFVGALIPFVQVLIASRRTAGDYHYVFFWYPLVLGVIFSVITIVRYLRGSAQVRRAVRHPAVAAPLS